MRTPMAMRVGILLVLVPLLAACLSSCDSSMPFVERQARISSGATSCVRDAILDNDGWDRKEYWEEWPETARWFRTSLLLRDESVRTEVVVTVERGGEDALLRLAAYVEDASESWDAKVAARRADLSSVYGRLRAACPDLPTWDGTTERTLDGEPPLPRGVLLVLLLLVPVVVLLSLWRRRVARHRAQLRTRA